MRLSGRLVCTCVLAGFLATLVPGAVWAKPQLTDLRKRLAQTSARISYYNRQLRQAKQKKRSVAHQLLVSEHRLSSTRANLRDIQSQLHVTRNKLSVARAELAVIRKRLKVRNDLLAARLVDTYKHGTVSYLSVIFGATDFWDLLSRGYIVRKVLRSDIQLIDAINEDKRAVERHENMLADQERRRTALEQQQRSLTRVAYQQTVAHEHLLQKCNNNIAWYEQMLAEEERNSGQIAALIRSLQKTPQGRKRMAQTWRGKFIAPVSSYRITSRFGMRFHPIVKKYRQHTGVDLACSHGTTIRAAGGGEVVYTGWMGAYGNSIIVDHGGGVSTVYAHCSSILARSGQVVKQGTPIGRVGSTGWSTGPHLHFEVRRNGVAVNPL